MSIISRRRQPSSTASTSARGDDDNNNIVKKTDNGQTTLVLYQFLDLGGVLLRLFGGCCTYARVFWLA
jgi:hypothetical protein